jgi:hypothetical protein
MHVESENQKWIFSFTIPKCKLETKHIKCGKLEVELGEMLHATIKSLTRTQEHFICSQSSEAHDFVSVVLITVRQLRKVLL